MDQLFLVSRVQIALFSVFKNDDGDDDDNDARLALATDILRLNEASELVDRCAIFEDDGSIAFDLGELLSFFKPAHRLSSIPLVKIRYGPLLQFSTGQSASSREPCAKPSWSVRPPNGKEDPKIHS